MYNVWDMIIHIHFIHYVVICAMQKTGPLKTCTLCQGSGLY